MTLVTAAGISDMLQVSEQWTIQEAYEGRLPCLEIEGNLYFNSVYVLHSLGARAFGCYLKNEDGKPQYESDTDL